MEEIIKPVSKKLLIAELTDDKRLRMTNKSIINQIYIITHHDSPNLMREIGRLREIAFRAAGGVVVCQWILMSTIPWRMLINN